MTPEQYCHNRAAKPGSSLYYSLLFLPAPTRLAVTALYAFRREVADVIDECRDVFVARTKLDWWRAEISNAFHGRPYHPVTRVLSPILSQFSLIEEHFQEIIDGMQMDLECYTYQSFTDLSHYCYRVSGVVSLLSAETCGFANCKTKQSVLDLGMGLQLMKCLQNVHKDIRQGHLYIPLDEMESFNVSLRELNKRQTSKRVKTLFSHQCKRIRKFLNQGLFGIPDEDRIKQSASVTLAALHLTLLGEIEADGLQILEHRMQLTPLRKLWIAWSTVRRDKRRYRFLAHTGT